MTLREMLIERVLWSVTEQELIQHYQVTEQSLADLTDGDLLDLYEDVVFDVSE